MGRQAPQPAVSAPSAERPSDGVALTVQLSNAQLEQLAALVAPLLADRSPAPVTSWLDTAGAAEHLCCSPGRIHDLVQLGKLTPRRDGRRLLFRRADLDAYLEASA
jgi:excisionase family DNA binding protein